MEYTNYFHTEDERSSGIQIVNGPGVHFQLKKQGNFRHDQFRVNRGRGGGQHFRHQNDSRGGRGMGNNPFQVKSKDQNWRRGRNESRGKGGVRGRERRAGKLERVRERGRGTGGDGGGGGTGRQQGGERGRRVFRRGQIQISRGNDMFRQPAGGSSSEEDNSAYCEYCNLEFKTSQAYHVHTRGMLHTQRVLEGKKSVREKPQPYPESNEKSGPIERSGSIEKSGPVVRSKSTKQSRPIMKFELTQKPESTLEPIIIDESDSDEETDTTYCMYCNMDLKTTQAYYVHTRGMLHTQKVIDDNKMVEPQAEQETTGSPKGKDGDKNAEDSRKVSEPKEQNLMKIPVKERDYAPNDVVREQISVPYHCKLCDVLCTGPITYKMHLDGSKHKMNVALAEKGEMIKDIPGSTEESQPSTFSDCVKDCDDTPLIGLQYVTEFHTDDGQMTQFVCNLCECWCDGKTIIPHLIGLKHRQKYFEEEHPHIYNHITSFNLRKNKAELTESVTLFAKDVEEKEGRKEVKIRHVAAEDKNGFSVQEKNKKDLAGKHKAFEAKMTEEQNGSPPKKSCIGPTFDRDTMGEIRGFERPKRGKFDGTGPRRHWQEGFVRNRGSGRHAGFKDKCKDTPDVRSRHWLYKRQGTHPSLHPSYSHYDNKYGEMEQPVSGQEMARYHDLPPQMRSLTSASFVGRPSMEELENRHKCRLMQQSSRANERQQWEVEESHMQTRLNNTLRQNSFVGFNSSTEQYQNQLQSRLQQPPSLKQQQQQWDMVSTPLEHIGTADDVDSATHKGIVNMSGKGVKKNPSQLPNLTQLMQHINTNPATIRPLTRPATGTSQSINTNPATIRPLMPATGTSQGINTNPATIRPLTRPATGTGQGIHQEMTRQVRSHQLQTPASAVLKQPLWPSSQQGTSSLRASAQVKTSKVSQRPQPSEQALKDLRKRAEAILNKCLSSTSAQ